MSERRPSGSGQRCPLPDGRRSDKVGSRNAAMSQSNETTRPEARRTVLQRFLDVVEKAGNKVPHPAVLFFLLIVLVVGLSHIFYLLGTSVSYQRINPQTYNAEEVTTAVNSLLEADGIRFICTSAVPNFINFGP